MPQLTLPKPLTLNEFLLPWLRLAAMLLLYALLRGLFYAYNANELPGVRPADWADFARGGLRFDLAALLYLNAAYIVAHHLTFRWKFTRAGRRTLDILYIVPNVAGLFLACCDLEYFPFTLRRSTWNVLDQFQNGNTAELWGHFLLTYWPTALLFVALLMAVVLVARGVRPKPTGLRTPYYIGCTLISLALCVWLTVGGIRGDWAHSTRPLAMTNAAVYAREPQHTAIVLNTPFCFLRTIGKHAIPTLHTFTDAELAAVYTPEHPAPGLRADGRRPNVVMFILESFSREFSGAMNPGLEGGSYRGYTPFLDSLMSLGRVQTRAFANGHKSIDAMPSILAGVPSLSQPFITCEYGNDRLRALPALLAERGYHTAFFHGAANGSMGFDSFARQAGFQQYHGRTEYNNDEDYDGIWGIWDHRFFAYYLRCLNEMPEPFMTALFSLSSHDPFRVPPGFEGRYPQGGVPLEQCIAYTDDALRSFFHGAREQPWFRNTLFVLVADHNVPGDHEEYRTPQGAYAINMLFYAPGDSLVCGRDTLVCQQADIMPSVLSYVGCDAPYLAFGNDLGLTATEPRPLRRAWALNWVGEEPQLIADTAMPRFTEAYLQQYNNRLVGDSLFVK